VRVRLRYTDVASFCEKFAPNVTRGGIFLASREPRPVGSVLRFEVCLQDGTAVLAGEGKVTWVKEWNPAEPAKAHGMGVQFLSIAEASKANLDRILQLKELAGRRNTMTIPTVGTSTTGSALPGSGPVPVVAQVTQSGPYSTSTRAPGSRDERLDGAAVAAASREYDALEESSLRRILDRARGLSAKTEDPEALLAKDDEAPATLADALAEMPRMLQSRRNTGLFRAIPDLADGTKDTKGEK
jgi:uncharacterized protein (TIGR02266 family)